MRPRSANEWRDFWRDGGERELATQLDELEPYSVRIATLLGSGERLFDGVTDLNGLELARTVAAPKVTHLKFSRRGPR